MVLSMITLPLGRDLSRGSNKRATTSKALDQDYLDQDYSDK